MKKGKINKITIGFSGNSYDTLIAYLYQHGILAFEEHESAIDIYLDTSSKEEFLIAFMKDFKGGDAELLVDEIENKNWNEEWEKSIEPIFIEDKIIIYPSWRKNEITKYKNRIKVRIDPKMAFGTGHNETTRLVLKLMTQYLSAKDRYLLDYGCGTGILAIAGIKMGVEKAVANEIDEDSIENAVENFSANRVSGKIKLYQCPIEEIAEKNFDVICANIISSVIIETLGQIKCRMKKNSKLFLSGILKEEKRKISGALKRNGFEIIDIQSEAEWLGVYAKNIQ
ncbi:MAG: 50S ribosomal protein L11 methyltransferase [Ignavibacteria bacterium]|nr:50S ribosomal protein L11 methyltransferase [Ignavibacteria bacterium]